MDTILELLQDNMVEAVVTVVFTFVILSVGFAWGRRRMAGISQTWETVAATHGLNYASNPITYDYGSLVGNQTWDYPGMEGQYRRRQVQVQTSAGMKGREAGRFMLVATVQLEKTAPFTALTYKRPFNDAIRQRIKKDTKSNHKALKAFKIRSEDIDFLVNLSQTIDLSGGLKTQKFRTGQFLFDGKWFVFEGATSCYKASPEDAIALLDWLCDIADRVDASSP